MSLLSQQQARGFLEPLRDKLTIFRVDDRESNLAFARFFLDCSSAIQENAKVLDTDAFYVTNIGEVAGASPAAQVRIQVPTDDLPMEEWLLGQGLASHGGLLLIDDLNAVLHLLSTSDKRSSLRRLYLLAKFLSFLAGADRLSILATTYSPGGGSSMEREPRWRRAQTAGSQRTLEGIGDLSVSVGLENSCITFRSNGLEIWKQGTFTAALR